MKRAVMEKWVKALRSHEYEQGKNNLCSTDGYDVDHYCCLGVAFDVLYDGEWMAVKPKQNSTAFESWVPLYIGDDGNGACNSRSFLEVSKWNDFGVHCEWQQLLARLNDGGQTFDEIADFIEENYEKFHNYPRSSDLDRVAELVGDGGI